MKKRVQPQEIIHLTNGEMIAKPTVGERSTNSDKTEEYGFIKHDSRTIQVKLVGSHLWVERTDL